MTAVDERPSVLGEWEAELEEGWPVASAQGTGIPSLICHRYPCPGSRQPVCGTRLPYPSMLNIWHACGPCPNGHPLCPGCYPGEQDA